MRGFLAFGVGDIFSGELEKLVRSLPADPGLRPLPVCDYHVTIKYLSEFSSTHFVKIMPELCELGAPPVRAVVAGRLAFWPTVLALECEASDELVRWHGRVNELLERKGFLKETHPRFQPHITLARKNLGGKHSAVESFLSKEGENFYGTKVPLVAPSLWRSQAEETGRRHQPFLSPLFSSKASFAKP